MLDDTLQVSDKQHYFRFHPTARNLLESHSQTSWSRTDDGLICAPVGYGRILEQNGYPEAPKGIAFAFNAHDLDLIPDPKDASRKILKNAAFILPPVDDIYVNGIIEMVMRKHEGEWLAFVLGFGNLYYTDRTAQDGGHYFSNNFISYAIFRVENEDGSTHYELRYRTNPFSKAFGFGMDQAKNDSFADWIKRKGITLEKFDTLDQATDAILPDFRVRYKSFLRGLEVQHWSDRKYLQNIAMWINNQVGHSIDEPFATGTIISKLAELMLTKLAAPAIIIEAAIESLELKAEREREEAATQLEDVADIEKHTPAPLHRMKDSIRENWVAVENVQDYFQTPLPLCSDIESHERSRAIDVISGEEPALVRAYTTEEGHCIISARTINGLDVHHLSKDNIHYITYVGGKGKSRTAKDRMPELLKPLFSDKGIAHVQHCNEMPDDTTSILHAVHSDVAHPDHCLIYDFHSSAVASTAAQNSPHMLRSIAQHSVPDFMPPVVEASIEEKISAFKKCGRALMHYVNVALPFRDGEDASDYNKAYLALTIGALAYFDVFGHLVETGAPWLFAFSAGAMAKRLAANALSDKSRDVLNCAARVLFTAGPLAFMSVLVPELVERLRPGIHRVPWNDELKESVGSIGIAFFYSATECFKAVKEGRSIIQKYSHPTVQSNTL